MFFPAGQCRITRPGTWERYTSKGALSSGFCVGAGGVVSRKTERIPQKSYLHRVRQFGIVHIIGAWSEEVEPLFSRSVLGEGAASSAMSGTMPARVWCRRVAVPGAPAAEPVPLRSEQRPDGGRLSRDGAVVMAMISSLRQWSRGWLRVHDGCIRPPVLILPNVRLSFLCRCFFPCSSPRGLIGNDPGSAVRTGQSEIHTSNAMDRGG